MKDKNVTFQKKKIMKKKKWRREKKKNRPWWDSNPQSPAPEADALSIRPQGLGPSFRLVQTLFIVHYIIHSPLNTHSLVML